MNKTKLKKKKPNNDQNVTHLPAQLKTNHNRNTKKNLKKKHMLTNPPSKTPLLKTYPIRFFQRFPNLRLLTYELQHSFYIRYFALLQQTNPIPKKKEKKKKKVKHIRLNKTINLKKTIKNKNTHTRHNQPISKLHNTNN